MANQKVKEKEREEQNENGREEEGRPKVKVVVMGIGKTAKNAKRRGREMRCLTKSLCCLPLLLMWTIHLCLVLSLLHSTLFHSIAFTTLFFLSKIYSKELKDIIFKII